MFWLAVAMPRLRSKNMLLNIAKYQSVNLIWLLSGPRTTTQSSVNPPAVSIQFFSFLLFTFSSVSFISVAVLSSLVTLSYYFPNPTDRSFDFYLSCSSVCKASIGKLWVRIRPRSKIFSDFTCVAVFINN